MDYFIEIILILIIAGMGLWIWYLVKKNKENEKEILALEKEGRIKQVGKTGKKVFYQKQS